MHLVFRIRDCYAGEQTIQLSRLAHSFQRKFMAPVEGEIYHGGAPPQDEAVWDDTWERTAEPWGMPLHDYLELPYTSHQDYVRDLMYAAQCFPHDMSRKGSNKQTHCQRCPGQWLCIPALCISPEWEHNS